ncbi:hypothetical protein M413DRAFT_76874 [Hebeloma cylindrosporum]|uniref:Fungal-type protein kinase domain-containing protein n=1 Tax=Hebeloma cylindrosporum TaxID=76867 RepID=A0A0C3BLR4_HEBCY|nr:hypothetical protein M413DRAFT_76874 [Hebeloma cylindrosporum h7]
MATVWPQPLLTRFATIPANPKEIDYYAPYNKLLNFLFPPDGPFTVGPQTHLIAESRKCIDFLVEYLVFWENVPVFILDIRAGPKLGLVSAREEADLQIRRRLRDLIDICPLPKLYAISAMGTKLCFYTAENGRAIIPPRIVADDQLVTDTAPVERWDCDVLEAEGAARLKALVHEIHQACAHLDSGELYDFSVILTVNLTYHYKGTTNFVIGYHYPILSPVLSVATPCLAFQLS